MKVKWSDLALEHWQTIADYIFYAFGFAAMQEYEEQTHQWEKAIVANPAIGTIEPLLQDRTKCYRFVIIRRQTKMVYFVENDMIVIANLWDTRQEPNVQLSHIE